MTLPTDPFFGAKLKVERAEKHIADLHAILQVYRKSNHYTFGIQKDAQGRDSLDFKVTEPLPKDVPVIIGDVLHNLRSALDILLSEALAHYGLAPVKQFPVLSHADRKTFEGHVNATIQSHTLQKVLIDIVKSYKGENDALCTLNTLNIRDKHILILPVEHVAGMRHVSIENEEGTPLHGCTIVVTGGELRLPFSGKLKVTNYGEPMLLVCFEDVGSFEEQHIIDVLHHFSRAVRGTIESFEIAVFGAIQDWS